MSETISSDGSVLIPDPNASIPEEAQYNPLSIFNEDGNILLLVCPDGNVEIRDQEGLRVWAEKTSKLMKTLNSPPIKEIDESDL